MSLFLTTKKRTPLKPFPVQVFLIALPLRILKDLAGVSKTPGCIMRGTHGLRDSFSGASHAKPPLGRKNPGGFENDTTGTQKSAFTCADATAVKAHLRRGRAWSQVKRGDPTACITFEGESAQVTASLCEDKGKTLLDIASLEWDCHVKRFISDLR